MNARCYLLRKRRVGVKQVGINQDLIFRRTKLKRQIRHANEGIKEAIAAYDRGIYDL